MRLVGEIIWWALFVYMWLIICRVIIGWLPVRWPRGLRPLVVLLYDVTEPVLSSLRRFVPTIPVTSQVNLDVSPFIAICAITLLQWLIRALLY